jgi:hypothetical protein
MDRFSPMRRATHPSTVDVGRRALALWAMLLWLLGFELAPGLHLGMHGSLAAHSHGPIEHHDVDHDHHDVDDHDHHEFSPVDGHESASELDLDHGDHELLHRGIAALQPPLVVPPIRSADFVQLDRVRDTRAQLGARVPTTVRVRGPPRIVSCCMT